MLGVATDEMLVGCVGHRNSVEENMSPLSSTSENHGKKIAGRVSCLEERDGYWHSAIEQCRRFRSASPLEPQSHGKRRRRLCSGVWSYHVEGVCSMQCVVRRAFLRLLSCCDEETGEVLTYCTNYELENDKAAAIADMS